MYFVLLGEWNPSEYVIHTREKTFQPDKRESVLKHAESHRCEVSTLGIFACNISSFQGFSKGIFFRKSLTESERKDQCKPGKILKIIEHFSYSIRYCKYNCLYSGSSSL